MSLCLFTFVDAFIVSMSDNWKTRDVSDPNNKDYCLKWWRLLLLWEKLTSSVSLRRRETTQSFKLGCVIATKLGALVPPPPCWSCPPGIPSPTGGNWCVSVRLCSSRTGPGSDSCVSPERSRRSRRRRVPLQPYLFFLRPLLFHPVLKLQLSSHNSSRESRKTHNIQHEKREPGCGGGFHSGTSCAQLCAATRRFSWKKKKVNPECVCAPCFPGRSSPHSGIFVRWEAGIRSAPWLQPAAGFQLLLVTSEGSWVTWWIGFVTGSHTGSHSGSHSGSL